MSATNKKLLIIDSHAVLHRAFHALPPLKTKRGELINAVYGFLLVFFKAINEFDPDFVIAAFDVKGPTFRHKKFKEYKAKRPKPDQTLIEQIPKTKQILKEFGVPVLEKPGFEADDIIATIAKQAKTKQAFPKAEVTILTGDLDALQLIDSQTKVYALRRGVKDAILYDAKQVKEKYDGLIPSQLLDFRALRGDPSDNIPGVTGIGEKTAIQLLKSFGTLENLYKEIAKGSAKAKGLKESVQQKLIDYKEQAFLSQDLARMKDNAPIDFNLKNSAWKNHNQEKIISTLKKFEFYSLIKRMPEKKPTNNQLNLKL